MPRNKNRFHKSDAVLSKWRENPAQMVNEEFGAEPDKWQHEALKAFPSQDPDKIRISLQACAGPGKSTVLSWCAWNFMTCYGFKNNHPKGAAISMTRENLKDNLWAEIASWRGRSEYLKHFFDWNQERIFCKEHPETWFVTARSFKKAANVEEQGRTLSGLHAPYMLYLIDESGDIPPAVLRSAEQGLSNVKWGKIMQAGNPTSHEGMLYLAATKQRDSWYIIRITSDPDDPLRTPRVSKEYANDMIKQYGRDNPWVMSYILGQFPPSSINTLLSPQDVEVAMNRKYAEESFMFSQKRMGVDVAFEGNDSTVIFPRQGCVAFKPIQMRNQTNPEIAARVIEGKYNWGAERVFIDNTGGFGGGVIDFMKQAGESPLGIHFASKAIDKRYFNKRSEMWFIMSERIKQDLALPNNSTLSKELTAPTYSMKNGALFLEPKEMIKKRLGFSPDFADSLALTFALPEAPAKNVKGVPIRNQQTVDDYNPYDTSRLKN